MESLNIRLTNLMGLTEKYLDLSVERGTGKGVFELKKIGNQIDGEISTMSYTELKSYYDALMDRFSKCTKLLGESISIQNERLVQMHASYGDVFIKLSNQVQNRLFNIKFNVDAMKGAKTLEEMYKIQANFSAHQLRRTNNQGELQVTNRALDAMSRMIDEKMSSISKEERNKFVTTMSGQISDFEEQSKTTLSRLTPAIDICPEFAKNNPRVIDIYNKMANAQREYIWREYERYNNNIVGLISVASNARYMFGNEGSIFGM